MKHMCRPPRFRDGNVTYLKVPKLQAASAWPWMAWHAEWWESVSLATEWQPIGLYRPPLDEGMAIASPVLLRDATRWLYGSLVGAEWSRFSEGGSYPIEEFAPTHWAEPSLDDSIMLSQD